MNKSAIVASAISGSLALYYFFKPALPLRLRYWLRRVLACWTRAGTSDWPIKPGTETPPLNWPGWPQGRQFAFVLTHDAEGKTGGAPRQRSGLIARAVVGKDDLVRRPGLPLQRGKARR